MALEVECACGKVLTLTDREAGRRVRCTACGTMLAVPGAAEDEEAPPAPRRKKRRAAGGGRCARCGEGGEGEAYHYFAATLSGVSAKGDVKKLRIQYTTSYRDVAEESVFLCDDCAGELWQGCFKGKAVRCAAFAGVALAATLVLLVAWVLQGTTPAAAFQTTNQVAIGVLLALGVAAVFLAVGVLALAGPLWRLLFPLGAREVTERVVVEWLRSDGRRCGRTIWTAAEFVRQSGQSRW
jgi:hypothetical protein